MASLWVREAFITLPQLLLLIFRSLGNIKVTLLTTSCCFIPHINLREREREREAFKRKEIRRPLFCRQDKAVRRSSKRGKRRCSASCFSFLCLFSSEKEIHLLVEEGRGEGGGQDRRRGGEGRRGEVKERRVL